MRALTATNQNAPPQAAKTRCLKTLKLSRVTRHSMVLVIAQHHLPKPCTDLARAVMLPAAQLSLD